jgi:phage gp16-like protein
MQAKEKSNRQKVMAQIHIAKKQLGLDNDVYRELLNHETGKTSCKTMSIAELFRVVHVMKQKGWKPKTPSNRRRMSPKSGNATIEGIDKIRAIWITMAKQGFVRDGSEAALDSYVKRMTAKYNKGAGVESVAWLKGKTVLVVLESIKNWHKRCQVDALAAKGIETVAGMITAIRIALMSYDRVCSIYNSAVEEGLL